MKTRILTAIAALAASAALAQTNTVLSKNAVGYVRVDMPGLGKLQLVGVNFTQIGGSAMTLLDAFGTNQLKKSNFQTSADKILLWDAAAQAYVAYAMKADGLFRFTTNYNGTAVNPTLDRGQGLWLQSASAETNKNIYFMGEVPSFTGATNLVSGGAGKPLFLLSNPYPVATSVHSLINTNDGAKASNFQTSADKMILWDVSGQQYVNLGLKTDNLWHYTTNYNAAAPTLDIAPGQGFFFQANQVFTWQEAKPYTWP